MQKNRKKQPGDDAYTSPTWQEILERLTHEEQHQVITGLAIPKKTLDRWMKGQTSMPRDEHIQLLVSFLPYRLRAAFCEALRNDPLYRKSLDARLPKSSREVPHIVYETVIELIAQNEEDAALRLLLSTLFVALQDTSSLTLQIVKCTAPLRRQEGIRSLYQYATITSWPLSLSGIVTAPNFFLGAESPIGQALKRSHRGGFSDQETVAKGFPLLRGQRVGGMLWLESTNGGFLSNQRCVLIQSYQSLITAAISSSEYFAQEEIDLQVMPPLSIQKLQIAHFSHHVAQYLKHGCSLRDAEDAVRRQIERTLLASAGNVR